MPLDIRDRIIQETAPIVPAPNFGELPALEHAGHRYIAARDGVLLEVRRPWLHLRWPITEQGSFTVPLPFGLVSKGITLAFGKIDRALLARFLEASKAAYPHEHAAWLVWDAREQRLKYRELEILKASAGQVEVKRPALEDHESLAVDLHSHADMDAFFSSTDDADDAGEVKISGVVGRLGAGAAPVWAFRLCALRVYLPLPGPRDL